MSWIFISVYVLWFLSEIILNTQLRAGKADKQNKDKSSLSFIWITLIISMTAASLFASYYYYPFVASPYIRYTGAGIVLLGIIFRLYAIKTLGRYFTVNVTIREGHKIIKQGLYKYLRHPSYTGSLLSFVGFGISLNNWVSFLIVMIPVTASFIRRMNIEERALTEQFGEEYITYKKQTWRLLPFIY